MAIEEIEWNAEKNQFLMEIRGVSFDLIAPLIREGDIWTCMRIQIRSDIPDSKSLSFELTTMPI